MIAKDDANKLLEGLDYFTQNRVSSWKGMPRGAFLYSLTQIFLTEDLGEIRGYLNKIIEGQILPNVIPQEIYEKAQKQGIPQKSLEQNVQKQKSYIQSWLKSIKSRANIEQTAKTQVKAAEAAAKIEKESAGKPEPKSTKEVIYKEETKKATTEKTPVMESVVTPDAEQEIPKEVPVGQKLENIQIKFDVQEIGSVEERLNAVQPFIAASYKIEQSEFLDLNPSLNLISKGISSEQLKNASALLPESLEKKSLFRISYTMSEIERIFPNEISRFKNLVSVENLKVSISNTDFTPSQNNILLKPNVNSFGGYTAFDGSSGIDTVAGFAKDQVLDKASDAVLSKVKTEIGGKLAKGAIGKAISSVSSKFASSALGKAIGAIGGKIITAIGSIGGPLGLLIGAVINTMAGWIIEKLLPLLQKIKDTAKKTARGVVATAATIILLPFVLFASSIALPFVIILITLPISIAIIMFIINSGAYIVPPKPSTISAQEMISPYIDVTKTANPAGPFKNSELPLNIEYTVEIKAKKSGISNIQIKDVCTVTKKNSSPSCPVISSGTKIPTGDEIPKTITSSQTFSFKYKRSFSAPTFEDTLVVDTVTVTADAPEQKGAVSGSSAIIKIGNPPEQCPSGWPVSGSYYLTQGPGGSYSHSSLQAIDIKMPTGTPIKATHSGIATVVRTSNAYRPMYIDIVSNCNGKQFHSRYAHLSSASIVSGANVTKGQTIGNSGSDGTGPHLHYGFYGIPMTVPYIPKSVPPDCSGCMSTN